MKAVKPTTDNWKVSKYNEKWTISQQTRKNTKINIAGCGVGSTLKCLPKVYFHIESTLRILHARLHSPAVEANVCTCFVYIWVNLNVYINVCVYVHLYVLMCVWNPTKRKAKTQQFSNAFASFWNSISQRVRYNMNYDKNNNKNSCQHSIIAFCVCM